MARAPDPPLTLILDPDDRLESLERLRRLHARPFGQILCEPDPTATSGELARYILEALGKHSQAGTPGELWTQVESQLHAERARELVIVRAHTLSFAALRALANHAHDAGTSLWLLAAAERPPAAIAQLLEARPYETSTVQQLIDRWSANTPVPPQTTVPTGAGLAYPYLQPPFSGRPPSRSSLCAGLDRSDRALVTRTWDTTQEWMHAWLAAPDERTVSQLADAIYTITATADTPSEMLTRAQAAIDAVHRESIPINRELFTTADIGLQLPETRPSEYWNGVTKAAT